MGCCSLSAPSYFVRGLRVAAIVPAPLFPSSLCAVRQTIPLTRGLCFEEKGELLFTVLIPIAGERFMLGALKSPGTPRRCCRDPLYCCVAVRPLLQLLLFLWVVLVTAALQTPSSGAAVIVVRMQLYLLAVETSFVFFHSAVAGNKCCYIKIYKGFFFILRVLLARCTPSLGKPENRGRLGAGQRGYHRHWGACSPQLPMQLRNL